MVLITNSLKRKHYQDPANDQTKVISLFKISVFPTLMFSMAVIFNLMFATLTHLRNMTYAQITAVNLIWLEDVGGQRKCYS